MYIYMCFKKKNLNCETPKTSVCGVSTIFYALACQHGIDITQQQDWQQDMATLRKRVVLGLHEGRLTLK